MADVFISFGSPDAICVNELARRLRAAGIDHFKYDDDSRGTLPGGSVGEQVALQISAARVAILCMSDQAVGRDWLQREFFACFFAYVSERNPMCRLLLVKVGSFQSQNMPSFLGDPVLFDLASPERKELDTNRLLAAIREALNLPRPRVIPSVMLAMRGDEPQTVGANHQLWPLVRDVSTAAGMSWNEPLPLELLSRYGETSRDFAPYPSVTMEQLVNDAVEAINATRSRKDAPLDIAWYESTWLVGNSEDAKFARKEHFVPGSYLVVVDSISLLHDRVLEEFRSITAVTGRNDLRAFIWVPPYTLHSAVIEDRIATMTASNLVLEPAFSDWTTVMSRAIAFDAPGKTSAKRWVHSALTSLVAQTGPIASRVREVAAQAHSIDIEPKAFFGGRRS